MLPQAVVQSAEVLLLSLMLDIGEVVTINFDWLNKGAKVILTYTYEGAPDYEILIEGAVVVDDGVPNFSR